MMVITKLQNNYLLNKNRYAEDHGQITRFIVINRVNVLWQQRRTMMLNTIRNVMFRGVNKQKGVLTEPLKQEYATWNTCLRIKTPEKNKLPPPMEIDAESGLEIMHDVDYSGKNHFLLFDRDFKSEKFFKIFGSFTTKETPFKKKEPHYISDFTLEFEQKKQFFHLYDTPRLLRKTTASLDELTTISLSYNEYSSFLKKIKTE